MTLEEMARKEEKWVLPSELDLFCYCVNAETGHQRLYYEDVRSAIYRCYSCGIKKIYSIEEDREEQK